MKKWGIENLSNTIQNKVYLLMHAYEYAEIEKIKTLGIYSSAEKANDAVNRYFLLDGFKNYPIECFYVEEVILDIDSQWNEGFVSTYEIALEFEKLTNCFNEWLDINKTPKESWIDNNYYNALCDVNTVIHKINDEIELAKSIKKIWDLRFTNNEKRLDEYVSLAKKIKSSIK